MAEAPGSGEGTFEAQKTTCIFCKIVSGEIPSRKVYDDDKIICLLDIFPAGKGHLLMLTKEHYPFLPLVPVDTQLHMFRITKAISNAAKSAMIADKSTVFIANGAIAGQQSPHFIYHIIPRDGSDGLDNFAVPSNEADPASLEKLAAPLRQRLAALLGSVGVKKEPPRQPDRLGSTGQRAPAQGVHVNHQREDLAQIIYSNPQLKELIIKDPEGLKKQAEQVPELKALFTGVDIDKLSAALKKVDGQGQ